HSAFARGIASFEDDHESRLGVLDPVLQLDELGLQRKKMLKVLRSIDRRRVTAFVNLADFFRQRRLRQFEFKVLVERVGQLRLKPIITARTLVHPSLHNGWRWADLTSKLQHLADGMSACNPMGRRGQKLSISLCTS